MSLFEDWVSHVNSYHEEEAEHCYSVTDLWSQEDPSKVSEMLCFCLEFKQQNGNSYTPKSLLQILINLQNYARSKDDNCFNFMNAKDTRFTQIHNVLDNVKST